MGSRRTVQRAGVFVALLAAAIIVPISSGDIFHLKSGGTVEGEIVSRSDTTYTIRTVLGTVALPIDSVVRIEQSEPPFKEYERRREAAANTPEAQTELAEWCGQAGMMRERTKHLQAAIALNPDYEPARRALGYVRIGELWVEARTLAEENEKSKEGATSQPADDPEKLAAAVQANWTRRIRAIKSSLLDSNGQRGWQRGEEEILEIRDPLAILPLAQILGEGNLACRTLLGRALMRFEEDEAMMNLAALALMEPNADLRADLMVELARRNDPRVVAQFRKALQSNNDILIRRAAYGLGELKAKEAVGELISVLKARRRKMVEVPVGRYLNDMSNDFGESQISVGGAHKINRKPIIGIPGALLTETEQRMATVTVYRTEVMEALKKITNENFGFEEAEWTRWYQEQKS